MPRKKKGLACEDLNKSAAIVADEHLSSPAEAIDLIRYWHRQRCFAMEQRKRVDLALGSFLRTMLGWSLGKPEAERKAIAKQAAAIVDDPDLSPEWAPIVAASMAARLPFAEIEKRSTKEMAALAKGLPVWLAFGEPIRGFGEVSLAVIVAEAGDLANYATHQKLWKRMGLAVMDGVRQGGLTAGSKAGAWIAHGYNRVRRSRVFVIGDALIKSNRDGIYRQTYLERKAYELARDPGMKPIKAHRRAQRYMEKRLLKHLWQAWRRTHGRLSAKAYERLSDASYPSQDGVPPDSEMANALGPLGGTEIHPVV